MHGTTIIRQDQQPAEAHHQLFVSALPKGQAHKRDVHIVRFTENLSFCNTFTSLASFDEIPQRLNNADSNTQFSVGHRCINTQLANADSQKSQVLSWPAHCHISACRSWQSVHQQPFSHSERLDVSINDLQTSLKLTELCCNWLRISLRALQHHLTSMNVLQSCKPHVLCCRTSKSFSLTCSPVLWASPRYRPVPDDIGHFQKKDSSALSTFSEMEVDFSLRTQANSKTRPFGNFRY